MAALSSTKSITAFLPPTLNPSPFTREGSTFGDINFDTFASSGVLSEKESSVFRMVETNGVEYCLADKGE